MSFREIRDGKIVDSSAFGGIRLAVDQTIYVADATAHNLKVYMGGDQLDKALALWAREHSLPFHVVARYTNQCDYRLPMASTRYLTSPPGLRQSVSFAHRGTR